MSGVQHLTVSPDDDGQRLDRWLKKNAPDMPFGLMQKLIRKGQVRVDGKRVKPDTRLSGGQSVRLPPLQDKDKSDGYRLSDKDAALIKSWVVYDDGDVIALNKPAGIASQGGMNIERHVDGMTEALTGKDGVKPRLVHRLDRDTSGVLLLARSAEMARQMGKIFQGRHIKKIYWAVTSPAPEINEGEVNAPLKKGESGADKEKMIVDETEGQHALTLFEVVERAGKKAAFVAFWPRTGRTHQIRAHAWVMGCPILGDEKYARVLTNPEQEISFGVDVAPRLHLHARSVSFRHPRTRKDITIEAPLSPELAKSWQTLGFDSAAAEGVFGRISLS